ncbi:MAG: hydantoinase/carbamoylase family amidase [Selenomonas sp.]|nr:hydantoinase/carbamoylase family amidase [Selenomonas sp.]
MAKTELRVNGERLLARLQALAAIGANAHGGIDRQLASDADVATRAWLQRCWGQELGLRVRTDAVLNLWGEGAAGTEPGLQPLIIGSHHDTVPNGGRFDGALGVLMATEALQTLQEQGVKLRHPVWLLSFAGEEPNGFSISTFGSKVLCGRLTSKDIARLKHRDTGEALTTAIDRMGGDAAAIDSARLQPGCFAGFMECHIEQGRRLIDAGETAAAVSCITGIYREVITVQGEANHAGTTLYKDRRDALAAAAEVVLAVESLIKDPALAGVAATIGHIEVSPNASNIVPGTVTMSLDLRTADPALRQQALGQLGKAINEIAARRQVQITRTLNLDQSEMPMHPVVRDAIHDACVAAGQRDQVLVSMAGHDAANMARLGPAGMLFIASVDGYSHCPQEYSRDADVVKGANIYLQALCLMDRRLDT